jgi:hypothetical protein
MNLNLFMVKGTETSKLWIGNKKMDNRAKHRFLMNSKEESQKLIKNKSKKLDLEL